MSLAALNVSNTSYRPPTNAGGVRSATATALAPDLALANAAREGSPRGLALEAARTLVTEAFVKPVFAAMQEGSLAAGPFKPGVGERRFRPLLDAALSGKVVEGSNFELVERLADRFERAMDPNAAAREVANSGVSPRVLSKGTTLGR